MQEINYDKLAEAFMNRDDFKSVVAGTLRGKYSKELYKDLLINLGLDIKQITKDIINKEFVRPIPVINQNGYRESNTRIRDQLYKDIKTYMTKSEYGTCKTKLEYIIANVVRELINETVKDLKEEITKEAKDVVKRAICNVEL